jgi:adenylate cyclase
MQPEELEIVFIIADLCGYTALTEAHGNLGAAQTATRYAEIARAALQPGARFVERVGDEVVIAASDTTAALRSALALRDAIEQEPLFPTLRTGIHAGTVVEQDGSYFGSALNLAARVAAHARGGQILCTEPVVTRAADLSDIAFAPLGRVVFKNVRDPMDIFEVVTARERGTGVVLDPVCRMQVRPENAPARLPYAGTTYHFCSFACAKAFAEGPERYVDGESSPA